MKRRITHILLLSFLLFFPVRAEASLFDYLGDKAAEFLKDYLADQGIDLSWKNFQSEKTGGGLLAQDWDFSASEVCVKTEEALKSLCFEEIEAALSWSFEGGLPDVTELGPIRLKGGRAKIDTQSSAKKQDKEDPPSKGFGLEEFPILSLKLPGLLRETKFSEVSASISDLVLITPEETFNGSIQLHMKPENQKFGPVTFEANVKNKSENRRFSFQGKMDSKSNFLGGNLTTQANAEIVLPNEEQGQFSFTLRVPEDAESGTGKISLQWKNPDLSFETNGTLAIRPKKANLTLDAWVIPENQRVGKIGLNDCKVELADQRTSLDCPAIYAFSLQRLNRLREKGVPIPQDVRVILRSTIKHPGLIPSPGQNWKGFAEVEIKRVDEDWITLEGNVRSDFSGNLAELAKLKAELEGDLSLNLRHFSSLVAVLDDTPFAVFTPLRVLDGSVKVSLKPTLTSDHSQLNTPLKLSTNLHSEEQSIVIEAEAQTSLHLEAWKPRLLDIQADADIENLVLVAPPLNPVPIPQLALDSRILLEKPQMEEEDEAPSKAMKVNYNIHVETTQKDSIKVRSQYTQDPLTLSTNVTLNSEAGMTGVAHVGETRLDLFRRDARIESFELNLREPIGQSQVDGRISVRYVDYTIYVEIIGTIDGPRVVMQSEPPLPEDDVLSVLLYGEPMTGLDSTDSGSVGEMSAALADRAVSLASLYTFASTPIQRVGYNPGTGKVSAKIKLAEGTSLVVGGSDETQEAGIRRRLGAGWYFTTLFHTPSDEQSTRVSALLEWLRRF